MTAIELAQAHGAGLFGGADITLLLIDDHAILRDGLRALFEAERNIRVIGEAGNLADGIVLARRLLPDVVIIDISFPEGGGLEAIGTLRRECDGVKIVVLTVHNTQECLQAAMRAGAHGYVAKDAVYGVLLAAVRSATADIEQLLPSLQSARVRGTLTVRQYPSPSTLTTRERQVLVGVAQGQTSKEIAASLARSVKTIVKHRSNMMRKLSLHDASSVTRYAIANGLLSL